MFFMAELEDREIEVRILSYNPGCDFKQTGWGYGDCEPAEPEEIELEIVGDEEVTDAEWSEIERQAFEVWKDDEF